MLNFKNSVFKRVGIFSKSTHGLRCKFSEESSKLIIDKKQLKNNARFSERLDL